MGVLSVLIDGRALTVHGFTVLYMCRGIKLGQFYSKWLIYLRLFNWEWLDVSSNVKAFLPPNISLYTAGIFLFNLVIEASIIPKQDIFVTLLDVLGHLASQEVT